MRVLQGLICSTALTVSIAAGQIIIGGGGGGGGGGAGSAGVPVVVGFSAVANAGTQTMIHNLGNADVEVTCRLTSDGTDLVVKADQRTATQLRVTFPATGGPFTGSCRFTGGGPGPAGAPGEVTSDAGTYADGQIVVASGTSGNALKPLPGDGVVVAAGGVASLAGTTGTGAVVLNTAPVLTGFSVPASATADISAAALRIPTFTTPAPTTGCDEAAEIGNIRLRSTDPATANGGPRICQQTGASTYGWSPMGYKVGITPPATCAVGDLFVDSDATPAGQQLYVCSPANTWVLAGDGGGGGGGGTSTIQDEGTTQTATATTLNFTGAGVTATAAGAVATINIPGGGGSGGSGAPFSMSVNTTADTVTLTALRDANFLRGKEQTTVLSGETFTWSTPTGSGNFIIYYTGTMVMSSLALSGIATSTTSARPIGTNANATTGLTLPQGAIPLFEGSVSSNNFVNVSTARWSSDSAPYIIDPGTSIAVAGVGNDTLRISATSSGGGAAIDSTTGALKGDGAGNAVAVAGTATDCVRVDGSSGACGGGGASPGGSGTEIQYRSGAATLGAVTGSSVAGANMTITGSFTAGANGRTTLNQDGTGGWIRANDNFANNVYWRAKDSAVQSGIWEASTSLADSGVQVWPKGGVRLNAPAAAPACTVNARGLLWMVVAAAGASDVLQMCMKAADNTYAWRTVFTAP